MASRNYLATFDSQHFATVVTICLLAELKIHYTDLSLRLAACVGCGQASTSASAQATADSIHVSESNRFCSWTPLGTPNPFCLSRYWISE